jgi:pimeloyl-ACP methyl ester carboxylesterase
VRRLSGIACSVGFVLAVGVSSAAVSPPPGAVEGSWAGTYNLTGSDQIALTVSGKRALVALGPSHAGLQTVPLSFHGETVRFELPGRPTPVTFVGTVRNGGIAGVVTQAATRGTFRLRHGAAPGLLARGLYGTTAHMVAVIDDPYGPERLVDLESGEVHGLYPKHRGFEIGAGFASRAPAAGTATFGVAGAVVRGVRLPRLRPRELEVRFRSGPVVLAGTLTIPPGPGRHAAVVFVQGSGETSRAYLPDLQALLLRHGVAVLAYDKRGIGQSGGLYPGESPTASTIDVLARDAAAAVRFLAGQPAIDPARVGLAGHSQAGWIAPLAASRERAVRFLVLFSAPAVTADEVDLFQNLTGEGEHPAGLTDDEINARVEQAGPSGVDPLPWIRALRVPALWLYGGLDRHIPSELSVRRLRPLVEASDRDFRTEVFPKANHALVETKTGLTSEMLASDSFAPGMFRAVGDWLSRHHLART